MTKELKLRLTNPEAVLSTLHALGVTHVKNATYEYTYFNQPQGNILKLTKKGDTGTFKTIIKPDGQQFIIESSDKLANPEQVRQELTAQYGVKKQLVSHRSFYSYEGYKISINNIEQLGTFLIIEGEDPQLAFATDVLGIQKPDVITESFDNVRPSHV